jgi:hypothetical protein
MPIVLGDIAGDVFSNLEWQRSSYDRRGCVSEVEFVCRELFELTELRAEDICICQVFGS